MDSKQFKYQCQECKKVNILKLRDPIRCSECGYRILYKMRSVKSLQYDAI